MSIYNFSVLKRTPIEVELTDIGMAKVYPIKFHGSNTYFEDLIPWVKRRWWPKKYDHYSTYELLRDRALVKWGEERPEYGIMTPGHSGRLTFKDKSYPKGLPVFKINDVAWQEDDQLQQFVGYVQKVGKSFKFIPATLEMVVEI